MVECTSVPTGGMVLPHEDCVGAKLDEWAEVSREVAAALEAEGVAHAAVTEASTRVMDDPNAADAALRAYREVSDRVLHRIERAWECGREVCRCLTDQVDWSLYVQDMEEIAAQEAAEEWEAECYYLAAVGPR